MLSNEGIPDSRFLYGNPCTHHTHRRGEFREKHLVVIRDDCRVVAVAFRRDGHSALFGRGAGSGDRTRIESRHLGLLSGRCPG